VIFPATNIVRLKSSWEEDYKAWCQRDLGLKRYVYWWADGVYFNVRLDEERSCVLALIGALEDGTKELLALSMATGRAPSPGANCLLRSFCSLFTTSPLSIGIICEPPDGEELNQQAA
jgi:transposase-like protein